MFGLRQMDVYPLKRGVQTVRGCGRGVLGICKLAQRVKVTCTLCTPSFHIKEIKLKRK